MATYQDPYQDPYQQNVPRQKQGMGCFAKGCLTLLVVLAILAGIGGLLGYKAYTSIKSFVGDKPASIRVYPATDAQYQAVLQKMQPFALALDQNQAATLSLSVDELNILVARDPNFAHLRGKAYFSMENDDLVADMSFPLENSQKGGGTSGYFNGHIVTGLSVSDGDLQVEPKRIEPLNGQAAPGWINGLLSNKDFMRGFNEKFNRSFNDSFKQNPKAAELLNKLQSLEIKDSRLVLVSKGEPGVAAPAQ